MSSINNLDLKIVPVSFLQLSTEHMTMKLEALKKCSHVFRVSEAGVWFISVNVCNKLALS